MKPFRIAGCILCGLFAVLPARAAGQDLSQVVQEGRWEFQFDVSSGAHDRLNSVVMLPLDLPEGIPEANTVEVYDQDGCRKKDANGKVIIVPIKGQIIRRDLLSSPRSDVLDKFFTELFVDGPFQAFDKDGDGQLRKEEVPDRMKGYFEMMDTNKSGSIDPGDKTPKHRLVFILPKMKGGEKYIFTAVIAREVEKGPILKWYDHQNEFYSDLRYGRRRIVRYMYRPFMDTNPFHRGRTSKVFHHVFDPDGVRYLSKGPANEPGRRELFSHQRGLFYGYSKMDYYADMTADTWHCHDGEHQSHEKALSTEAGPVLARHRVAVDWHGKDRKVFANEERELAAYAQPDGNLIEWSSRLKSAVGPLTARGNPDNAGFQFRAAEEVSYKNVRKQTFFLRFAGGDDPQFGREYNWTAKNKDDPNTTNLPWDAMSFVAYGQRYTLAHIDHPQTHNGKSHWSERAYGRVGSFIETDIDTAKPLEVRYRVWVQNGPHLGKNPAANRQQIAAIRKRIEGIKNDFVNPVQATIRKIPKPAMPRGD